MWLKRRTPQNIVIGGAAGAFPPMIGWAAVTGDVSLASISLFALIFMWTPPHFWALALFRDGDYAKAGVPMLPVVAGARETKQPDAALHAAAGADRAGAGLARRRRLCLRGGRHRAQPAFIGHAIAVLRELTTGRAHRAAKAMFGFLDALSVRPFRGC